MLRGRALLALSVTMLAIGVAAGVGGVIALVHPPARAGAAAGGAPVGGAAAGGATAEATVGATGHLTKGWAVTNPGKPTSIEIPSIGVRSRLVRLGLEADGRLEAPRDWDTPGWYGDGGTPGQVDSNPAVIAGHVDSRTGPAVFYRLRDLKRGDQVIVRRDDGVVARFTVDGSRSFAKSAFPDAAVYGPVDTATPQLRLITCTGSFDRKAGSYRDDLVVFAHRTG
jgi:sortase (surface protein transpeptidase)